MTTKNRKRMQMKITHLVNFDTQVDASIFQRVQETPKVARKIYYVYTLQYIKYTYLYTYILYKHKKAKIMIAKWMKSRIYQRRKWREKDINKKEKGEWKIDADGEDVYDGPRIKIKTTIDCAQLNTEVTVAIQRSFVLFCLVRFILLRSK